MAEIVWGWAPNTVTCCDAATLTSDTSATTAATWTILASDGTVYTTLANLLTAGKIPFGLGYTTGGASPKTYSRDPGMVWTILNLTSDNGSLANSSGGYYALNQSVAPSALTSGGVEALEIGGNKTLPGSFSNVWVYKITAGDVFRFVGKF